MLRIGPAGLGSTKQALATLEAYHAKGFRACELAFVHSIYITNEKDAQQIGAKAAALNISLSIHAPYYVNLNASEAATRKATKERILGCAKVAEWLGGATVVFHPGYYGKDRSGSYKVIREGLHEIVKEAKKNYPKAIIAPETMGKINVFGSIEEVSSLVTDTRSSCCIDFAHILARDKHVDYEKVKKLFPQPRWHVHFSGIEYGEKGEKNHRTTTKEEWTTLLKNLPKNKDITIICESPRMIEDCSEALKIALSLGWKV
jgi:deoxyribonuclease-4